MTWPPVKAWTSKQYIDDQLYFVAINYGGKSSDRWVVLMSVLDSSVVVKVSWSQLLEQSIWESGWDGNSFSNSPELVKRKCEIKTTKSIQPSQDSGLTIPINENTTIRPWFDNI